MNSGGPDGPSFLDLFILFFKVIGFCCGESDRDAINGSSAAAGEAEGKAEGEAEGEAEGKEDSSIGDKAGGCGETSCLDEGFSLSVFRFFDGISTGDKPYPSPIPYIHPFFPGTCPKG